MELLGQRWYDGGVGRFISRDPIGEEGGLNLYVYVGNNGVNYADPEGENPYLISRAIACAICAGLIYKDAKDKWSTYEQFFQDCPQKSSLKEKIKCYAKGILSVLKDQFLPCEPIDWIKDISCVICLTFPWNFQWGSVPQLQPVPIPLSNGINF